MTTVRRLLLELGVVGDLDVKTKLQDIQNSADILKKSLQEVEIQLTTLGRVMTQTPQFGGFGGSGGSGVVLTSTERRNVESTQSRIREQIAQTQMRESKQLEVAEKTVSLQEQILEAMKAQVQGQQDIIKKQMSDIAADRQMFKNTAENLHDIVNKTIGFVQKAPRPLGRVGRPPKKYEYIYDKEKGVPIRKETDKWKEYIESNRELIKRQKDAITETTVIAAEMKKKLDPKVKKEMLDKLDDLGKSAGEAAKAITEFKDTVRKSGGTKKYTEEEVRAITKFPIHDPDGTPKSNAGLVFPFREQHEDNWLLNAIAERLKEKEKLKDPSVKPFIPTLPEKDPTFTKIHPVKSRHDYEKVDVDLMEHRPHYPEGPIDKSHWFLKDFYDKQKQGAVVKPFVPEAAMRPQAAPIDTEIADIERELARIKAARDSPPTSPAAPIQGIGLAEALKAKTSVVSKPKPKKPKDERDVHKFVTQLLHKFSKESKEALTTPELQRSRIAAQVANEFERADIKEKASKIREEIEEELIHEQEMKKRGFIFKPAEKIRRRGVALKSKYEDWKESVRERAVGFVSKQKGFMAAGKYISEREKKRKELAEKVAAASEEGKQIVHNFTFEINNPIVDNDERMQTFIRSLTQAFKGMI